MGDSRSALVSRAVRQLLQEERRVRDVEQYVEAYRCVPESRVERRDRQKRRESLPRVSAVGRRVRRGEIWWARLDKPRSVVLVSRDEAYDVRVLVVVAGATTTVRGYAVEVKVGRADSR